MFNSLINKSDPVVIGNMEVEVTIEENHDYINNITKYKVEEGFDITDHVHQEPEQITISGVFSDTPLPFRDGKLSPFIKGAGENRTQKAIEELFLIAGRVLPKQGKTEGLAERDIENTDNLITPETTVQPKVVDITSGLRVFTNMICISLKLRKDRTSGYSLPFIMTFQKIYTVASELTTLDKSSDLNGKAPNVKNSSKKTKTKGAQTVKKPKSVFKNIYDYFGSLGGR